MNFKKVFMSMLNLTVLAVGLMVYTPTCSSMANDGTTEYRMVTRLWYPDQNLLIEPWLGLTIYTSDTNLNQYPTPMLKKDLTNALSDVNFGANAQKFWTGWNLNTNLNQNTSWNATAGTRATIEAQLDQIKKSIYATMGDYRWSWMYVSSERALIQAAYYARTADELKQVQAVLDQMKTAKFSNLTTYCYPAAELATIQSALNTKDLNFLNAQATAFNTSMVSATTYATVKSIINNALAYTPAYPDTSFATLGTTLLNAFNKAITLAQPTNYQELKSLITTTAAIAKYGQTFASPLASIDLGLKIDALNLATTNKNFDSIVAALNNVVGTTTTDATLKTNLNTAVLSALKTAAGLVTTDTQCNQLSSLVTTATTNAAINAADLTKIATEVGYVTQFYTSSITFDGLNSALTNALKIATPVTTNFANHIYKALTTLITLIPSGMVRSPVTTRADTSANKAAATTRKNALNAAKATLNKARTTAFMKKLQTNINSELISKKLPKN